MTGMSFLDVVFQKIADTGASAPSFAFPPEPQIARPWPSFANAPTQGVFSSNLVPRLRGFLKTRLPAYMLPSTFIVVNELPLTPNGKIDRKALPAPTFNALPSRDGQELRSPVERKLGELFVEILGLTNVGIHDDFFTDLGGIPCWRPGWRREFEIHSRSIFPWRACSRPRRSPYWPRQWRSTCSRRCIRTKSPSMSGSSRTWSPQAECKVRFASHRC